VTRFAEGDYDENFPNEWALWERNFERHLKGPQGQKALLDLHAALLSLPERKLISGRLADEKGCVCTVGALALRRRTVAGEDPETVIEDLAKRITEDTAEWDSFESEEATISVGIGVGLKRMMAQHLGYLNDQDGVYTETPEARFERILRYVEAKILPVPV
jgi:hypothetical protein